MRGAHPPTLTFRPPPPTRRTDTILENLRPPDESKSRRTVVVQARLAGDGQTRAEIRVQRTHRQTDRQTDRQTPHPKGWKSVKSKHRLLPSRRLRHDSQIERKGTARGAPSRDKGPRVARVYTRSSLEDRRATIRVDIPLKREARGAASRKKVLVSAAPNDVPPASDIQTAAHVPASVGRLININYNP